MAKKKAVKIVRGHWPKGVRRNEDKGNWSQTLLSLTALIDEHWIRGTISYQACAVAVGVDPKTVARWRDGIDRPSVETQEIVARWVADRRAEVGSKKEKSTA